MAFPADGEGDSHGAVVRTEEDLLNELHYVKG